MKVYLAGPMSGYPAFNRPAFAAAARVLRGTRAWRLGGDDLKRPLEVVSPAELDDPAEIADLDPYNVDEASWRRFLARDILIVADEDTHGVVVLPGWQDSQGAQLEVLVARRLGKPIITYPELVLAREPEAGLLPETVFEEAQRLVHGARGQDYGHPAEDFAKTAGAWTGLFQGLLREGARIEPRHVPLAMICVKLSRLMQSPDKRDSIVDVVGYAETYAMEREHAGAPLR